MCFTVPCAESKTVNKKNKKTLDVKDFGGNDAKKAFGRNGVKLPGADNGLVIVNTLKGQASLDSLTFKTKDAKAVRLTVFTSSSKDSKVIDVEVRRVHQFHLFRFACR